MISAFVGEWTK